MYYFQLQHNEPAFVAPCNCFFHFSMPYNHLYAGWVDMEGSQHPYRCEMCGRSCKSAEDLTKHFKQLHERELKKKLSHKWVFGYSSLTSFLIFRLLVSLFICRTLIIFTTLRPLSTISDCPFQSSQSCLQFNVC